MMFIVLTIDNANISHNEVKWVLLHILPFTFFTSTCQSSQPFQFQCCVQGMENGRGIIYSQFLLCAA